MKEIVIVACSLVGLGLVVYGLDRLSHYLNRRYFIEAVKESDLTEKEKESLIWAAKKYY